MARQGSPRVARDVRAAIADALATQVAHPRLALVTITEVELTPDHEHATVYWSTPDPTLVAGDRRRSGARPARHDEVAVALEAALQQLIDRLRATRSNEQFLQMIAKSNLA